MKKIKVFLASSIDDLRIDRLEIGDFFRELNDIYEEQNIQFKLIKCENYDKSLSIEGKQSEYDEEIRESDLVFFLFFTKVGIYTKHEFEVAFESFKNIQKPKIITYFKYVNDVSDVSDEIKAFMGLLDSELHHYYNTYQSIDTLKLGILMQIKLMKLDSSTLDIENGKVRLNGKFVADSENIPIFEGNENLISMRRKLVKIDKRYYELHEQYQENREDIDLYQRYSSVAKQRNELINQIRSTENEILGLAEKIAEDTETGKLSSRHIEGFRLLEQGDYDGALEVLDLDEILTEIKHNEKLADHTIERLTFNLRELELRIATLKTFGLNESNVEEIKNIYEEAYRLVRKYDLNKDILLSYTSFLYHQNNFSDAITIAEQLKYYYSNPNETIEIKKIARLYNILGALYYQTKRYNEAEKILIYNVESLENSDVDDTILAETYYYLSMIYKDKKRLDDAEQILKKALSIFGNKSRVNEWINPLWMNNYAISCDQLGKLYFFNNQLDKAKDITVKAVALFETLIELCENKFLNYSQHLAISYDNLGEIYFKLKDYTKAKEFYNKANKIFTDLCGENPSAYRTDLAANYGCLGELYFQIASYDKAEHYYSKSIEIRKHITNMEPMAFKSTLSGSYYSRAILYKATNQVHKAETDFKCAIQIMEELYRIDESTYSKSLSMYYNSLGNLYQNTKQYKEANKWYMKSLSIIEPLYEKSQSIYASDVANLYNNIGNLYDKTGDFSNAKLSHQKALEIRDHLYQENGELYALDLIMSYNNLGAMYFDAELFEDAEIMFASSIQILEPLCSKNILAYGRRMLRSYNNLCILYKKANQPSKKLTMQRKKIEILESLCKENTLVDECTLMKDYYQLGELYEMVSNFNKAEISYRESIKICEKLYEKNPNKFGQNLVDYCSDFSALCFKIGKYDDMEQFSSRAKAIKQNLSSLNTSQ